MAYATPSPSSPKKRLPAQQKMQELLQSGLIKAGIDFEGLEKLYGEAISEFAVETDKLRSESLKESAIVTETFQRDLKSLQANLILATEVVPTVSQVFLLQTATSITSDTIALSATTISPLNNSAQFDFKTTDSRDVTLQFSYDWTNASDVYVVANIIGFIAFNGILTASTDGSFWPIDTQHSHNSTYGSVSISGITGLTIPGPALNADSGGGWLGNPGVIESEAVFRGLAPDYNLLLIPPQSSIQINVVGKFSASIDSGFSEFNFEGDGRQVTSAGALVSIVS